MPDDLVFSVRVNSGGSASALKKLEQSILRLRNATLDPKFSRLNINPNVVQHGLQNIGREVDILRKRAVASAVTFRKTRDLLSPEDRSKAMSNISKEIVASERAVKRVENIQDRAEKRRFEKFIKEQEKKSKAIIDAQIERETEKNIKDAQAREKRKKFLEGEKRINDDIFRSERMAYNQRVRTQNKLAEFNKANRTLNRQQGGGRGGRGGGIFSGGIAGPALVAGGALTGLTGQFGFLGVGFAAMSGGVLGAAIVGLATVVGGIIRGANRFEQSLSQLGGDLDKLSPGMARQVEAYTKATSQLERGILLAGLGNRTGTSFAQRVGAGSKTAFGIGMSSSFDALLKSVIFLPPQIRILIHFFEKMGKEAEKLAKTEEEQAERLLLGRKKGTTIQEQFIEAQDRYVESGKEARSEVDKQFKLQEEINRVSRLVSFGGLSMEAGAKFLAKNKVDILDQDFRASFVGLEELNKRITEASASRDKDAISKIDVKEMTDRIVQAINSTGDKEREQIMRFVTAIGENQINMGRIPGSIPVVVSP